MTRILSEGEHEYLQGMADVEEGSARERTMRNRIREHVKEAVKEFGYLIDKLEYRDKKQIFEDLGEPTSTEHIIEELTDKEPSMEYGLISMVAFVYECCQNSELDFETVVEHAIGRYYEDDIVVEIEVQEVGEVDVQKAAEKHFFSDEEVTRKEIEAMTKHLTQKAQKEHDINIGGSQS